MKRILDDLTVPELRQFCDAHGLSVSYCPDGSGMYSVSERVVHEAGKGNFTHREPCGSSADTLQEAYMAFVFKKSDIDVIS